MFLLSAIFLYLRSLLVPRLMLATQILVLRQQLIVLNRSVKRPKLRRRDRFFWVSLSKLWKDWNEVLIIVKPETVIKWHREGFRLYWRWKSKVQVGPPLINQEIRDLIQRISRENPLWGLARIQSERRLLGFNVAQRTIAKYRIKNSKPPSQTWRTFLANHANQIAAIDFFTIPTLSFRNLYCLIILLHNRREIIHFNVTSNPTAEWTAQQIINAFPENEAPRYLLRDREGIYGEYFQNRVEGMGIEQVITAVRSPWQNPFAERVIGSIRRECLDHLIIINESHLRHTLSSYFDYYVRHEVASITVKPECLGLHPLFHQRFPTGTCVVSNDGVRSCRNNVASSFWMAVRPRGFDCDCQPQGGRELRTDRMVKRSESLYTRRYRRNSARGCYAVTKMVRGRNAGCSILHRGHLGPPASRRDLTDLVIGPERGKVQHEVMKTTVACRMTTQPGILLSVFYLDVHHW